MIESSFRAALVALVGLPALPAPRRLAAGETTVALSSVAVFAQPVHVMAFLPKANPLPENNFAVIVHPPAGAGLDTRPRFVPT